MAVIKESYPSVNEPGKYEDKSYRFVMTSSTGLIASVITYGARIDRLIVPDKDGNSVDVMLGMKGLDEYLRDGGNHGAIVGRSANRIAGASFVLNGERYDIPKNDGDNNLHTGVPAFQNKFWDGEILSREDTDNMIEASGIAGIGKADGDSIMLTCLSADGECGFPGNLETTVVYTWLTDGTFLILYAAVTDKDTVFAPTNHAYLNIGGHNSGYVGNNLILVNSDKVILKNEHNCPDGRFLDVDGTVFDCRSQVFLSNLIDSDEPQITMSRGIDQNFCINGYNGNYNFAASLTNPENGIILEVYTDFPGIQLYAGNHLGGTDQKGDIPYKPYDALCLEAQMYPNSVNVDAFESAIVRKDEEKFHACGYKFGCV